MNDRIAAALDITVAALFAHLAGLVTLVGVRLAPARDEVSRFRGGNVVPGGLGVGDVVVVKVRGRYRLGRVFETYPGNGGAAVAYAVPSADDVRHEITTSDRVRLVMRAAELPVVDESDDAIVTPRPGDDRLFELVIAGDLGHLVVDGAALCGTDLENGRGVGQVPASAAGCLPCVAAVDEASVERATLGCERHNYGPDYMACPWCQDERSVPAPPVGGGSTLVDDAFAAGMLPLAGAGGFLF